MLLKTTPFHSRTSKINQSEAWKRWAGYVAATNYEMTHDREYAAIRNSAALFDVTPLFKYHISGPDAARLLDRVVTRNVQKCEVGQVMYTPWCDINGKVLDDGTVGRLAEDRFRFTSAESNLRWLHMNATKLDVRIEDVSDQLAALSLQGPTSRAVLMALGADVEHLKFFRIIDTQLRNVKVAISRTGYTGDLGYEIWIQPADAEAVWDMLIEVGHDYGLLPAGLLALDVSRIEAGLILLDVDYFSARHTLIEMQQSSPFEINLGWAVAKNKDYYVGKRALEAERAREAQWQFVGVDVDWESLEELYARVALPPKLPTVAWRTSVPLYLGSSQIGYATSGCWSPLLKKYIALAHVQVGKPGDQVEMEITVEHRRKRANATLVKTPFFDPPRKKS